MLFRSKIKKRRKNQEMMKEIGREPIISMVCCWLLVCLPAFDRSQDNGHVVKKIAIPMRAIFDFGIALMVFSSFLLSLFAFSANPFPLCYGI